MPNIFDDATFHIECGKKRMIKFPKRANISTSIEINKTKSNVLEIIFFNHVENKNVFFPIGYHFDSFDLDNYGVDSLKGFIVQKLGKIKTTLDKYTCDNFDNFALTIQRFCEGKKFEDNDYEYSKRALLTYNLLKIVKAIFEGLTVEHLKWLKEAKNDVKPIIKE